MSSALITIDDDGDQIKVNVTFDPPAKDSTPYMSHVAALVALKAISAWGKDDDPEGTT